MVAAHLLDSPLNSPCFVEKSGMNRVFQRAAECLSSASFFGGAVFCGLILAALAVSLPAAAEEQDGDGDKTSAEKPKEPPLKCSAWCAFRELGDRLPPLLKNDPQSRQSRPESVQWKGFARRGKWASIVLELKNTTEDQIYKGSASIQLDPVLPNKSGLVYYKTGYRQDIEIGPLTTKQYAFSVLCPENGWSEPVRVRIAANGGIEERDVFLHDLDGQDFIVVVSESSGAFLYLGNVNRNASGEELAGVPRERDRIVSVVEPAELPSRWHDLMLANLIIIDGPPREKFSPAQFEALRSYVQAGGQLLITAGKEPSRLKGPFEDLAGISVGGMTELESLDALTPPYQPNVADWLLPIVEARGDPAIRSSMDRRHNKKKNCLEMSRRFYGSGSVTFLPFSLNDPRLAAWPGGRKELPLAILGSAQGHRLFEQEESWQDQDEDDSKRRTGGNRNASSPKRPGDTMTGATDLPGFRFDLDQSFRVDTPVQTQKPETILAFLLLYIVCVVPVNYLLFGWLKRREVAWLAVPLWAAAFSVIAYAIGYMGQTGKLTINEVSIIEAAPGEGVGIARTFLALYAPRRDEYRLRFPPTEPRGGVAFDAQAAPGHLLNMELGESRTAEGVQEMSLVDGDSGLGIDRLMVQQRSTRRIEVVHRVDLGGGLEVKVKRRPQPGRYDVFDLEVSNQTPYDLYYPVFIHEGSAIPLSDKELLAAGESRKLEGVGAAGPLAWKEAGAVFFGKQIIFRSVRGLHAANRIRAVNAYVRDRVSRLNSGCAVCAWIETPVLPVEVAASGSGPQKPGQLEGITLLVAPVSLGDTPLAAKSGPLNARYALQYRPEQPLSGWQTAGAVVPMQFKSKGSEVYLELPAPANLVQLRKDGCRLRLTGKLAGENNLSGKALDGALTNGELKIEIRRTLESGNIVWDDITPENADFRAVQSSKPWRMPPVFIEMDDHRIRSGGVIVLRLTTRLSGNMRPLELRGLELKPVQRNE
jgi:hypothetical protein